MHDFKVGDSAYFTIHHLELYGEPETDIHGRVVGIGQKIELEVPYLGVFLVDQNKLKENKLCTNRKVEI